MDQTADQLPEILRVKDIQRFLRVSQPTAYKLVTTGKIKSMRIGGNHRILKKDFLEFIESSKLCSSTSN